MSVENVKAFYNRMVKDEDFRTQVMKDESLKDMDIGNLVAVAGKHGFEFTEADYEALKKEFLEKQKSGELSDLDLEMVAGGKLEGTHGLGMCLVLGLTMSQTIDLGRSPSVEKQGP